METTVPCRNIHTFTGSRHGKEPIILIVLVTVSLSVNNVIGVGEPLVGVTGWFGHLPKEARTHLNICSSADENGSGVLITGSVHGVKDPTAKESCHLHMYKVVRSYTSYNTH